MKQKDPNKYKVEEDYIARKQKLKKLRENGYTLVPFKKSLSKK